MLKMIRRINFESLCLGIALGGILVLSLLKINVEYKTVYNTAAPAEENASESSKKDKVSLLPPLPTMYDGLPDFDKILSETRRVIEREMRNYNFTNTGDDQLNDLLVEEGGIPVRSLIVTAWRSGSSFLGDLVSILPSTFYNFEPLMRMETKMARDPPLLDRALNTVKEMLKCNFYGMDDYFEYGKTHPDQFYHNEKLWSYCKRKKDLCYDADFTSRFCKLFPFQSMKVVHFLLESFEEMLLDKQMKMKAVFLVRDPRAVLRSRLHLPFCQGGADCMHASNVCDDMVKNYIAAERLTRLYPDKVMALRYEDLVRNLRGKSIQLFKFLGLNVPLSTLDAFLKKHTSVDVPDVYSTYRKTNAVPFRWKYAFDFEHVNEIQSSCKEAMSLWGYRLAENATHMASKRFNPIEPLRIKQTYQ